MEKIIIHNANIYTFDDKNTKANFVVISDGKILDIGIKDEWKYSNADNAKIIDAENNTIIPGIIDSHAHLLAFAKKFFYLDLTDAKCEDEILKTIIKETNKKKENEWIVGYGLKESVHLDFSKLSKFVNKNPIYLERHDGHSAYINNCAYQLQKKNGLYDKRFAVYKNEEFSGLILDDLCDSIKVIIPKPNKNQKMEMIKKAIDHCLSIGITTVCDAGLSLDDVEIISKLKDEKNLKIRVYGMYRYEEKTFDEILRNGRIEDIKNNRFNLRCIKIFMDGALSSRGAYLSKQYDDDETNFGVLINSKEEATSIVERSVDSGFQVAAHAIGDKANEIIMEIYKNVILKHEGKDLRLRIEHAQVLSPSIIDKLRNLPIVISMQPHHFIEDIEWARKRIGNDRLKYAYAWRSIFNVTKNMCFGSDFPYGNENPFLGIYAAKTRKNKFYESKKQKLSVKEALLLYTKKAAYAIFEDHCKGTLERGKLADLIMIDKDPFKIDADEIKGIKVLFAMVDGEI